jgi:hypothetical protein
MEYFSYWWWDGISERFHLKTFPTTIQQEKKYPNIIGMSGGAFAGLSYGMFKAIHHNFHCQLPSWEPLVVWYDTIWYMIGRVGYRDLWVGNPVSNRQSVIAYHKQTFHQDQKLNNKRKFLYWPQGLDASSQVSELCDRGCV